MMSDAYLEQQNRKLKEQVDRLRRERNQAWQYISTLNMVITLLEKDKAEGETKKEVVENDSYCLCTEVPGTVQG